MPLFWGDFLANTMHLSAQEAGAYLFLIAHAWENEGKIPSGKNRLARIAHVQHEHWNRVWPVLENFFEPINGNPGGASLWGYQHVRVLAELDRLGKISSKRKAAAMQMHSKSNGGASTSTSTSRIESSAYAKGMQPRARQDDASLELQLAQKQHLGISPDKGMDYRSPPAKKSENVLTPLPDQQRERPSRPSASGEPIYD
jgi:uncharacterized protein YdaU (DUF1376 family)